MCSFSEEKSKWGDVECGLKDVRVLDPSRWRKFPDISSERLRVCRDRSPALDLSNARLGYIYWDGFSNVLRGGGYAFQLRVDLVGKNWPLSDFLSSRVGGTVHSIDLG